MLCTDDTGQCRHMNCNFIHAVVNHGKDKYERGPLHTNTVEGYCSILKRGITGANYHLSAVHLHRYRVQFDFRYNTRKENDFVRCEQALKGIKGRRLRRLARQPSEAKCVSATCADPRLSGSPPSLVCAA